VAGRPEAEAATSRSPAGAALDQAMDEHARAPAPPTDTTNRRTRKTPARRAAATTSATPAERPKADPAQRRPRKAAATAGNGRRRRFSLPPLDDDSEKVSRSIESFLSGAESSADPAPADAESGTDTPPTTVALVAVTDASTVAASRNGHQPPPADDATSVGTDEIGRPVTGEALAAVERSLRSAARGTDRVDVQAAGRFRVVLASAGELAARAYIRRVRATVEPLLDELDPPRRLAVGTATVLGDPLDDADALAERRLTTAIDADDRDHRARDDDRVDKPRAAGD